MSGLSALKRQLRVSLAAGDDTLSVLAVHDTAAATPNATDLRAQRARLPEETRGGASACLQQQHNKHA